MEKEWTTEFKLFMESNSKAIETYHNILISESEVVPTYFVRYEDLVNNPKETMEGVFKFILSTDTLEGTYIQKRIDDVVGSGHKAG